MTAVDQPATEPTLRFGPLVEMHLRRVLVEPGGELVLGLADMDIYDEIDAALLQEALPVLRRHPHWFLDCNLPAASLDWLLSKEVKHPETYRYLKEIISILDSVDLKQIHSSEIKKIFLYFH